MEGNHHPTHPVTKTEGRLKIHPLGINKEDQEDRLAIRAHRLGLHRATQEPQNYFTS